MRGKLNAFEQFLVLLEALKASARGEPARVAAFWKDSEAIREAADALDTFLHVYDFERQVFHGKVKVWAPAPPTFARAWQAYKREWGPAISEARWAGLDLAALLGEGYSAVPGSAEPAPDNDAIDLAFDMQFDPMKHDGAEAIGLGIRRLEDDLERFENEEFGDEEIAAADRIALGAFDYLTQTIGLDLQGVFARWRAAPVTFAPAHVSSRHGAEKGSLYDLLDDATRAYVFGLPAAAMAMCRATLEIILKDHYVRDEADNNLMTLIALADKRYDFVQGKRLDNYRKEANRILHSYGGGEKLTGEDERTIQAFLKTLKFLIERAPAG